MSWIIMSGDFISPPSFCNISFASLHTSTHFSRGVGSIPPFSSCKWQCVIFTLHMWLDEPFNLACSVLIDISASADFTLLLLNRCFDVWYQSQHCTLHMYADEWFDAHLEQFGIHFMHTCESPNDRFVQLLRTHWLFTSTFTFLLNKSDQTTQPTNIYLCTSLEIHCLVAEGASTGDVRLGV